MNHKQEIRNTKVLAEIREDDAKQPVIHGYASTFDTVYDVGWFDEVVRSGAFAKTLRENSNIVSLLNHDQNYVIARTNNKTLTLREDSKGLYTESTPADTTWEKDLLIKIKRGDQKEMSFAFQTVKDTWRTENGRQLRELLEVKLFDVSVVTNGANNKTDASVRSMCVDAGLDYDVLSGVFYRHKIGQKIKEDNEIIERSIETLKQFLPKIEPGNHSIGADAEKTQVRNLQVLRRRLEIAELESNHKLFVGV